MKIPGKHEITGVRGGHLPESVPGFTSISHTQCNCFGYTSAYKSSDFFWLSHLFVWADAVWCTPLGWVANYWS